MCVYRERGSLQLGRTQGKVNEPIWSLLQPELHSQSKPRNEALDALQVPCPQFMTEHTPTNQIGIFIKD